MNMGVLIFGLYINCPGPSLKCVHAPMEGISSLQHVKCTTQLGVGSKLAQGALDPCSCCQKKMLNISGTITVEYLSLPHVPGDHVSHFLPVTAFIFPSLHFITNVPIYIYIYKLFLLSLIFLVRLNSIQALAFLT